MLTKANRPAELSITLTLRGQGKEMKLPVVYHNRTQNEINSFVEKDHKLHEFAAFVIKDVPGWDYSLDADGLAELESDWPGATTGLLQGFAIARQVEISKN